MKRLKTILAIVGVVLTAVLLRNCVATSYLIPSSGMENSLYQGERILVNLWSYGLRLPLMDVWGYHRWNEQPVCKEDIVVFNNPANRTQPTISQREVFIGRCIGAPGDTLYIDSLFAVIPSEKNAPDQKFLYTYPREKEQVLHRLLHDLQICPGRILGQDSTHYIRSFSRYEHYLLEQAINGPKWIQPVAKERSLNELYPLVIPQCGQSIRVYPWNRTLLCNTLVLHEGKRAEIKNDTLYVEGRPTEYCRFGKDYHWIEANNAINLSDSRLFGLVPKDHIIGKAQLVWFSKKQDAGLFSGYRWHRIGKSIK